MTNEYYRLKRQEYRKKYREENRCLFCGKVPQPGRTRCTECIEKANKRGVNYMVKQRIKAKKTGRCTRCFRKLDEEDSGRAQCLNCRGGL